MKALIFNEKVIQVETESFPVCSEMQWVDITDLDPQPQLGWDYENGEFLAPPPPPEITMVHAPIVSTKDGSIKKKVYLDPTGKTIVPE